MRFWKCLQKEESAQKRKQNKKEWWSNKKLKFLNIKTKVKSSNIVKHFVSSYSVIYLPG